MRPRSARPFGRLGPILIALAACGSGPVWAQQGELEELREDVRSPRAVSSSNAPTPTSRPDEDSAQWRYGDDYLKSDEEPDDSWLGLGSSWLWLYEPFLSAGAGIAVVGVTSPLWVPKLVIGDEDATHYFPRFPYDRAPGYMRIDNGTAPPRRWLGRFQTDYAEDFHDLSRIGSRLLLETVSRWGADLRMYHVDERLAAGRYDSLWLGDANLVYRFAQSERWQWRAGVGLNWLADSRESNFGVNVTYGLDFYPANPWVLSTTLDWGTLGSADRFRFSSTIGLVLHGVETYAGYEYHDIDRFHSSSLVAGARVWF